MSTITQFPSGNTQYRIEFDYLARTFVVVTLVNSSDPSLNRVLEVGRDYRFLNPTMIEMLVDQSGFDIVRIHRQTGTDLVVDFRNGSVLTASDLTNAELQAIHIAEEGRDQTVDLAKEYAAAAGSSAGNAKDSEDEARRIAESIKASSKIGYITRRSFEKGFNVTTWNEVLLWEDDGDYYRWDGTLPKNVPAGSTPETAGGIGLGAWVSVGDTSLRADLSLDTGSTLVGYKGSTVSGAIDLLTSKKVYAVDFGVKADGSDDTAALQALSVAVSAMTDPVVEVVFPQGVSRVGYQDQAPTSTSGYSFRPGYVAVNGNVGWFFVNGRSGTTIINARGWTIKLNDGMKHGSFNPSTGLAHTSTSPFRDTNYQAYAGNLVAFKGCERVIRIGLTVDGSADTATWGGVYGDTGWQCISFGIWDAANIRVEAYDDVVTNCLLDNLYISTGSGWPPSTTGVQPSSDYYNGTYTDGRRQNITIAGGQNIRFHGGTAARAGRTSINAGSYYSAPEANVDIETESGAVQDVVFNDFKMLYGGKNSFLAASFNNPFTRATLNRCTLRSNSSIAQIYTTGSGIRFNDCLIEGSGMDVRKSNAGHTPVEFRRCTIRNHISGTAAPWQSFVGEIGVMEDCYWDIIMNAGMRSTSPLFHFTASDSMAYPPYPAKGLWRYNIINLSGNQDLITPATNGRVYLGSIQFFFDMDMRIITSGLTGTLTLDINTQGSTVNQRGITTDSQKVVDTASGSSTAMATGGFFLNRTMQVAAAILAPKTTGMQLGTNTLRLGEIYMGQAGIRIQDSAGGNWRITVTPEGNIVATRV